MQKYTKVVATLGPASDNKQIIKKLYNAGMNVARLNFSHGNHEYFSNLIKRIRSVSENIAIILDTKGPEIRTTRCKDDRAIFLEKNQKISLSYSKTNTTCESISVDYSKLNKVPIGTIIFFDDGLIETKVVEKKKDKLIIKILNKGLLESKKSVVIKGHSIDIPFLSKKDKEDILFGIKNQLDFIAASYVRNSKDVQTLKKFLKDNNSDMPIISKIEHWNSINNLTKIIKFSDGIMVARGDLGVEISLEKVPLIQRDIIVECNRIGRPVIVATQMLESMKTNPSPTRAEVSDVSEAILQGTDAIMLSSETTVGKYPVEAVKVMTKIAKTYDNKVKNVFDESLENKEGLYTNAISLFITKAAYMASKSLNTSAILTLTESGYTAKKVSRFKPKCPILAITRSKKVLRQLQLSWGVQVIYEPRECSDLNQYIDDLVIVGYKRKLLKKDDTIVVTAGHKLHREGTTNIIKIYYVKDILNRTHKKKIKEHIL